MSNRIQELFGVAGRTAVVTGGSRGIGEMIAEGFVDAGASVIITARKAEELQATADRLSEKLADGATVTAVPGDLSTVEGVTAFAEAVRAITPTVDILVNNAGATWGAPLDDYPESGWNKLMDVNLRGVFFLTQSLLPELRAAATAEHPARVINIGSVDGLRVPGMEVYAYSASKAAVHQLTRHLAARLAPEHVLVNAIAPGPFESKMMAFALEDEQMRAAVAADVPLGRIGTPDDMAGTALFLASRAGAYVTGAVLPVGGGIWSAQ